MKKATMSKADRQRIIEEYKKLPELTKKIIIQSLREPQRKNKGKDDNSWS